MKRILLAVFLALLAMPGWAGPASAQSSLSPAMAAKVQAYGERINELVAILQEANKQTVKPPPNATDPATVRAYFAAELPNIRASKAELISLRARFNALPPIEPFGFPDVDQSLNTMHGAIGQMLDMHVNLTTDGETLVTAMLANDRATVQRLAPKLQDSVLVGVDSSPILIRSLKVSTFGQADLSAQVEAVAGLAESMGHVVRLQLGKITPAEAAKRLRATTDAIRAQLPAARAKLDAKKLSDPAFAPSKEMEKYEIMMWKVMQVVEAAAGACDSFAAKITSGPASPADVQTFSNDLRGMIREAVQNYQQIDIAKYINEET